ncbi:MAG: hypothetical protein L6R40_004620 [Gallowayella cf. fulva]|nr:MAG: hypothetical protein L6R40_004620 [Xanthomendoza cf. fulva]
MDASTTPLTLPTEILIEIFTWAKCDRAEPQEVMMWDESTSSHIMEYPGDPNLVNPNEEHPSLKSFRQVCKVWYGVATPMLFRAVVLLPNIESWEHLDCICLSPHLAQHVQIIQVATIPLMLEDKDIKEWRGFRREGLKYQLMTMLGTTYPNGGRFAKLPGDDESAFQRYQDWCAGEKVILDFDRSQTSPALHLERLSSLQKVQSIDNEDLRVIRREYRQREGSKRTFRPRLCRNGTRREIETLTEEEEIYDVSNHHSDVFLHALDRSGARVDTLTLRSDRELESAGPEVVVRSLRRLELHFGFKHARELRGTFPRAKWVRTLTGLEELSVTTARSQLKYKDIFRVLRGIQMPKLRTVFLKYVPTSYDHLDAFVQAHKKTIQKLHIVEPIMLPGQWAMFYRQEKARNWDEQGKVLLLTESLTPSLGSIKSASGVRVTGFETDPDD